MVVYHLRFRRKFGIKMVYINKMRTCIFRRLVEAIVFKGTVGEIFQLTSNILVAARVGSCKSEIKSRM